MKENELQKAIDVELSRYDTNIESIKLGMGSDVTDLTQVVDVDVFIEQRKIREFNIRSKFFVDCVFRGDWRRGHPRPEMADLLTTGGPLIIVEEISGNSVVRAVLRYLELEVRY